MLEEKLLWGQQLDALRCLPQALLRDAFALYLPLVGIYDPGSQLQRCGGIIISCVIQQTVEPQWSTGFLDSLLGDVVCKKAKPPDGSNTCRG